MRRAAGLLGFLLLAGIITPPVATAADEAITIVGRFYPTPGREDELEARPLKSVEFVRKAEPNISYRVHRSTKGPTVFLYYEVYPSQAAFDYHVKTTLPALRKEVGPPPEGIFAKPPEVEFYRALTE